jgi:hypothetical protein
LPQGSVVFALGLMDSLGLKSNKGALWAERIALAEEMT